MESDVSVAGADRSDDLDALIRERIASLRASYTPIDSCRVVVKVPHRHRRYARHFHVRIEITMRGAAPVVLTHEPSLHRPLKNAQEAVEQAFEAARRHVLHIARTGGASFAR